MTSAMNAITVQSANKTGNIIRDVIKTMLLRPTPQVPRL